MRYAITLAVLAFIPSLGCVPHAEEHAENAAIAGAYTAALDSCVQNSKAYADYKACADKADSTYGRTGK